MRWLIPWSIAVVLVFDAGTADAFVVMEPVAHVCTRGKTWEDIHKCLASHGVPTVLHAAKGVRLVGLKQTNGTAILDAGVYLYVERKTEWTIGGLFEGHGTMFEVLAFAANAHTGYRLDIGQALPTSVLQEDGTIAAGTQRLHHVILHRHALEVQRHRGHLRDRGPRSHEVRVPRRPHARRLVREHRR